jgi:hypothetical protein
MCVTFSVEEGSLNSNLATAACSCLSPVSILYGRRRMHFCLFNKPVFCTAIWLVAVMVN